MSLPQVIQFVVVNQSATTKYVVVDSPFAQTSVNLAACSDNYQAFVAQTASCTIACSSDPSSCFMCGVAPLELTAISPGSRSTTTWDGLSYAFGVTSAARCRCHRMVIPASGRYRATLSVYGVDDASSAPTVLTEDFEYPDEDGAVTFVLN